MSLFKRYRYETDTPTVTVKVDANDLLAKLSEQRSLIETVSAKMAKQQEEIERLQRLVTIHDEAMTYKISKVDDTIPIYVNGEVHTRVKGHPVGYASRR